jgi:hypothetical protein
MGYENLNVTKEISQFQENNQQYITYPGKNQTEFRR